MKELVQVFELKVSILNPSIELMEIKISQGNRSLESILDMTDDLKQDISNFTSYMSTTILTENGSKTSEKSTLETINQLEKLNQKLDTVTTYIHLALTVLNQSVSLYLNDELSPSRLLQASALVSAIDRRIQAGDTSYCTIGNDLPFTMYSLFNASSRPKGVHDFTWKEELAKCQGHVERDPNPNLYDYQLILSEDFSDGRFHDKQDSPQIRRISVKDIDKMFYTSSGKLLNISDITSSVLVLKIKDNKSNDQFGWIALSLYNFDSESDSDEEEEQERSTDSTEVKKDIKSDQSKEGKIIEADTSTSKEVAPLSSDVTILNKLVPLPPPSRPGSNRIPTSALSLFEYILRLASAEVANKKSHLIITDDVLARYLQK